MSAADQFETRVKRLASRLRHLADEVEREGLHDVNRVNCPEFGWKAQQVVHAVMWGLANADLDGLVLTASEADRND